MYMCSYHQPVSQKLKLDQTIMQIVGDRLEDWYIMYNWNENSLY